MPGTSAELVEKGKAPLSTSGHYRRCFFSASIPSAFILLLKVVGGMPSRSAAPPSPCTLPPLAATLLPCGIAYDGTRAASCDVTATAGIALAWNGFSFVPGVTHSARAAYVRGTNSARSAEAIAAGGTPRYMTTKDSFYELDFDTEWHLYPQLTIGLQFGYPWADFENPVYKNTWRTTLSAVYRF